LYISGTKPPQELIYDICMKISWPLSHQIDKSLGLQIEMDCISKEMLKNSLI